MLWPKRQLNSFSFFIKNNYASFPLAQYEPKKHQNVNSLLLPLDNRAAELRLQDFSNEQVILTECLVDITYALISSI